MRKLKHYAVVPLLFFAFACAYNASMVKVSYNTLAVSSVAYDTGMKTFADLNSRNLIPADKKPIILEKANTYYLAHNAAVETLAKYQETKDSQDQQLLEQQLTLMSEALTSFLTIIKPYLED